MFSINILKTCLLGDSCISFHHEKIKKICFNCYPVIALKYSSKACINVIMCMISLSPGMCGHVDVFSALSLSEVTVLTAFITGSLLQPLFNDHFKSAVELC